MCADVVFIPCSPSKTTGYRRVTRNKGLSVRQYYELVGGTFDLRSKWEKAIADADLDAVSWRVARPASPPGFWARPELVFFVLSLLCLAHPLCRSRLAFFRPGVEQLVVTALVCYGTAAQYRRCLASSYKLMSCAVRSSACCTLSQRVKCQTNLQDTVLVQHVSSPLSLSGRSQLPPAGRQPRPSRQLLTLRVHTLRHPLSTRDDVAFRVFVFFLSFRLSSRRLLCRRYRTGLPRN